MISEKEKELYNTYLAVSRTARNQPFTPRKNFDRFEDSQEYLYIHKINEFLTSYPQILPKLFFKAPYELYKDKEYIDLKFYTTGNAIKVYTIYMNQLQEESPDSEYQIQFIKNSLRFIGMFCIENKIPIEEYILHSGGVTYTWMKHIKERKISIYVMFNFSNLFDIIHSIPKDEIDLLLGNIINEISIYKNRYDTSKQARHIIVEGFKRLKNLIDNTRG